ncbi:uncharacterized protein [Ptychodera flava]|uniref:uncharacterized protein n=1 Tax=Ptychodera flava TaxID=63121 RepID=UPI00396A1E2F
MCSHSKVGFAIPTDTFRVVYVPDPQNIANQLSRLLRDGKNKTEHLHKAEEYVHFVELNATPRALTTREVEEASAVDEEIAKLKIAMKTGRFDKCEQYAPVAGELCTIGQLVLRGTHIVLPCKLRPQALALAHEGHLGVVGTKQNLRSKVWWPGMDEAAEKHCISCHGCQLMARPDPPEPLRPTTLPDGPWQDVATDLLVPSHLDTAYWFFRDYYSRYYEYAILTSTTMEKIIDCLEDTFSRQGLPVTISQKTVLSSGQKNSRNTVTTMESHISKLPQNGHKQMAK